MLIADSHLHLSPRGFGAGRVAKKFRESGGWFMGLVSLPPHYYGLSLSLDGIIKSFEMHARMCEEVRKEGIKVYCLAGIHPASVDRLVKQLGETRSGKVIKLCEEALKILERMVKRGVLDGLGEFGRPHYRTLPTSFTLNELVLVRALELARDLHVVIHLHLEEGGMATVLTVENLVKQVGTRKNKVVFHHSTVGLAELAGEYGYSYTVLGKSEVVKELVSRADLKGKALLESDYLDDPRRPGAVMYPWDIASELEKLVGKVGREIIELLNIDNVVKVYGVSPP